jgi:DNA-binding IclR family transcriptional regulator
VSPGRYEGGRQSGGIDGALQILESVARFGTGVTAREISDDLAMPPATCYRLLNALVASEYLVRVDNLHGFALGRRTDRLVTAAARPFVPVAAREVLAGLRGRVRFGVHLVLYLDDTIRVGDADPDHPLHSEQDIERNPHASAAGKIMLAHLPDWRSSLPRLARLTPHTITDPDALDAALEVVRSQDLACQVGEHRPEVACLAVPVRSPGGTVVGAVCLAGPAARADALAGHLPDARRTAAQLSALLS